MSQLSPGVPLPPDASIPLAEGLHWLLTGEYCPNKLLCAQAGSGRRLRRQKELRRGVCYGCASPFFQEFNAFI